MILFDLLADISEIRGQCRASDCICSVNSGFEFCFAGSCTILLNRDRPVVCVGAVIQALLVACRPTNLASRRQGYGVVGEASTVLIGEVCRSGNCTTSSGACCSFFTRTLVANNSSVVHHRGFRDVGLLQLHVG